MSVKEISSREEFDTLIAGDKVIIVDFYTTWCGPCKTISPVFEKFAEEHVEKKGVEFYRLDIDAVEGVAKALGIRSIPTFRAFKGGETVDKPLVGASKPALTSFIEGQIARL